MTLPLPNSSGRFYMENSGIDIVNERESKVFPVPSIKCDVVLLGLCDMQRWPACSHASMWIVDEEFVWLHSVNSAGAFQIVATRGGHYGCRWVSVVITAKLKAKDRRLPHGRGAEGQIGSGQVQRSQGNNQGIPAALRCLILVTAIWALLLRSLQSRLYPTTVCQHSPPRRVWCAYRGILLFCCQHELHGIKGTPISKAEQKHFPEKCQEPLERAEKAACRLVLCRFDCTYLCGAVRDARDAHVSPFSKEMMRTVTLVPDKEYKDLTPLLCDSQSSSGQSALLLPLWTRWEYEIGDAITGCAERTEIPMRLAATYVLLLEVDTVTCSHPSVPTRVIEDEIGLLSSCAPSQGRLFDLGCDCLLCASAFLYGNKLQCAVLDSHEKGNYHFSWMELGKTFVLSEYCMLVFFSRTWRALRILICLKLQDALRHQISAAVNA
ncbi:hypothetical protein Anapl_07711 [Anas platyrhynchos]|uniref:Uncharacterized protein n=1 Tax=Anas platyrhynchos TaxID=8839 RepID=R0L9K2_ANAPL|nr:hypothetical protein Anapl_07711 [Anas platyrhynchos]